jgi:hypothetical protein
MYYAGLRPEEVIGLRMENVVVPSKAQGDQAWGELQLRSATPDAGAEWTDDGSARERRRSSTVRKAIAA